MREARFNTRDLLPGEYLTYLAIFAVVGSLFALGIDLLSSAPFWRGVTLLMRVFFS